MSDKYTNINDTFDLTEQVSDPYNQLDTGCEGPSLEGHPLFCVEYCNIMKTTMKYKIQMIRLAFIAFRDTVDESFRVTKKFDKIFKKLLSVVNDKLKEY